MSTTPRQRVLRGTVNTAILSSITGCLAALLLSACTTVDNEVQSSTAPIAVKKQASDSELNERSTTNMNQIGSGVDRLSAPQIASNTNVDQLTVDQLRAYADRCSPNASSPPPPDLDCSELGLRVKRVFRSDDKVTEALITLDRLGRNENSDTVAKDLKNGVTDYSPDAQAVAGGLLDPGVPTLPVEPEEEFEDFLNENGLAVNAGIIIANPQ